MRPFALSRLPRVPQRLLRPLRPAVASAIAALVFFPAQAQAPLDIRVALVIGNSSYADAPLANPSNDARAMSAKLKGLGFEVIEVRDAPLTEMRAAVAGMGKKLAGKQGAALFYYAGHGLQIDWHNYLVPVNARVASAAEVLRETLDVGEVIEALRAAKSRMNIIVLDACRDNPFVGQASGRGLAQMDAPPGTFLAFATAPGNVADDGSAGNGLYTQYLLAELGRPAVKIEDIFKRTRLAVRTASAGRQVPWESTSLEEDFYFQPPAKSALAPDEVERQFQLQLERWTVLQKSNQLGDLEKFLAEFPSGPFSELAQFRFNRIYRAQVAARAEQEAAEAARAKAAAQALAAAQAKAQEEARLAAELRAHQVAKAEEEARAAAQRQADARAQARAAAEIRALTEARAAAEANARAQASAAEQARAAEEALAVARARASEEARLLADRKAQDARRAAQAQALAQAPVPAPAGPTSASQTAAPKNFNSTVVALARAFKPGTTAVYSQSTWSTKTEETLRFRITGGDEDSVEINNGRMVWDRMGNLLSNKKSSNDAPRQFYPAEFQVGKRWQTRYVRSSEGGESLWALDVKVVGRERIKVPAGEFDTFLIKVEGYRTGARGVQARVEWKIWVDPGVSFDIATEFTRRVKGNLQEMQETRLISLVEPT